MEAKSIFRGRNFREFLEKNRETAKISPNKVVCSAGDHKNNGQKVVIARARVGVLGGIGN